MKRSHYLDFTINNYSNILIAEDYFDVNKNIHLSFISTFKSITRILIFNQFFIVKKLLQLNHKIGLHLDYFSALDFFIYNFLESLFGTKISSFSFLIIVFYSGIANKNR